MKAGTFHGNPVIVSLPGPRNYQVIQSPAAWFGYCDSRGKWWIPRNGDHTDQMSMTLGMQFISGVSADASWAGYTHDDAYEWAKRHEYPIDPLTGLPNVSKTPIEIAIDRDEADYYALEEVIYSEQVWFPKIAMNDMQREIIYHAVRIGGYTIWNGINDGRKSSRMHWA